MQTREADFESLDEVDEGRQFLLWKHDEKGESWHIAVFHLEPVRRLLVNGST